MGKLIALLACVFSSLGLAQGVTVVEYYNKTLDSYFITGRANEQALLDGIADFQRTGMTFQATATVSAPSTLTKICRFYISVADPFTSTHFYGREGTDCEPILAQTVPGFSWEGYDFATPQPTYGACLGGYVSVYRSFRPGAGGKTSNHRYTTSAQSYSMMSQAGWTPEGVALCVTAATDIGQTPQNPPVQNTAAGYWNGRTNTNRNVFAIILPTGESWVMYTDTGGRNYLAGVLYSQIGWTPTTFSSASGRDFSFENHIYADARISGTYTTRSQLGGTINYPTLGQSFTFSGTYNPAIEQQASLSAIAGTYAGSGVLLTGSTNTTVSIQASGNVVGVTASGCSFSGTITPISGVNAYRVRVTTVASNVCGPSITLNGAAYYDAYYRALNVITLDAGRTNAYVFLGSRN